MNIQNLMQQTQKMQKDIMQKKENFNKKEFIEEDQYLRIIATGDKRIKKVEILKSELLNIDDIEMLQDILCVTFNNLIKKIDQEFEKEMGQYGNSLNGLI